MFLFWLVGLWRFFTKIKTRIGNEIFGKDIRTVFHISDPKFKCIKRGMEDRLQNGICFVNEKLFSHIYKAFIFPHAIPRSMFHPPLWHVRNLPFHTQKVCAVVWQGWHPDVKKIIMFRPSNLLKKLPLDHWF